LSGQSGLPPIKLENGQRVFNRNRETGMGAIISEKHQPPFLPVASRECPNDAGVWSVVSEILIEASQKRHRFVGSLDKQVGVGLVEVSLVCRDASQQERIAVLEIDRDA
jgi:hypothetical protein